MTTHENGDQTVSETTVTGCQTCGGLGNHHDPVAHDWAPAWVTCGTCGGWQTVRRGEFDVTCSDCDGDGGREL